jgi:hypothetical protein
MRIVKSIKFRRGPAGTTPALERLQDSFVKGRRVHWKKVILVMHLTVVSGQQEIVKIQTASIRKGNLLPLSCTNDDAAVERMKDCEERLVLVRIDDFADEAERSIEGSVPVRSCTGRFSTFILSIGGKP